MRVTLALPAILLAGALVAHGQEPMLISGDPAAYPVSTGTATHAAAPQHAQWPAMPHFHGRGEWPGPRPCCSAPDGTVWGTCARPRSYVMHLWDDYCCERTKCPCCGWRLGSMMHYLKCERKRCRTVQRGCGCRQCGCASGACAAGGHVMTAPAQFHHGQPSGAPAPMRGKPARPKPPMMKKDMPKKKKEMKKKMEVKPKGKKEKADPKEKTSALDGLPAFFAPLLNGSK